MTPSLAMIIRFSAAGRSSFDQRDNNAVGNGLAQSNGHAVQDRAGNGVLETGEM